MMSRRDSSHYATLPAQSPDGGEMDVYVAHRKVRDVAGRSQGQRLELAHIMPGVLRHPAAIFEGLRRDEDEPKEHGLGWLCYCGVPPYAFHASGSRRPAYEDEVYLVFVNDEHVAYHWYWSKCDPDHPKLPMGYTERFRKRIL